MVNRVLLGALPDGSLGLRVSRPGYDVSTEPLGSSGISFDSRLNDFGIIHQQGIMGYGTINFPTLPYIPLASIQRIGSGGEIFTQDIIETNINAAKHWSTPFVGILTQSSLTIRTMNVPYYYATFPTTRWLYTIYAIEV